MGELQHESGRSRIEHEDNLINHRVSWLMSSQAFLLTAFVLLRNNPTFFEQYAVAQGNAPLPDVYISERNTLVYVITVAGSLIAACSTIGVFAAFLAIARWRQEVQEGQRKYLTSRSLLAGFGGLAAVLP